MAPIRAWLPRARVGGPSHPYVFYAYFTALGLDLTPEDASCHGRLDLTVRFNGQIYLFEFKVVELVPEGQALRQVQGRGYPTNIGRRAGRST